ncbi:MAG: hypothetical protein U0869_00355 [Chloroflexota bacterium]
MRHPRRPRLRRSHLASGGYALLITAYALSPVAGRSPAASPATHPSPSPSPSGGSAAPASPAIAPASPSAAPVGASPVASGSPAAASPGAQRPLPASIAEGSCDAPGAQVQALQGPVAPPISATEGERTVYLSRSQLDGGLADVAASGRIVLVGGNPDQPESAVACGSLDAPTQSPADLAIALDPLNRSGYVGTAELHEAGGTVSVTIVLVAPQARDAQGFPTASGAPASPAASGLASPAASGGAAASPGASPAATAQTGDQGGDGSGSGRAITSPIPLPSVQPGTSGAPPFSPMPQASAPA